MNGVAAVLFDLFDTLIQGRWRPSGMHPGDWLGMREEYSEVWEDWGYRRMTSRVPFGELLEEVYRRAGKQPDRDAIALASEERSRFKAQLLKAVDHEVMTMLTECRRSGVAIAVVSGCAWEDVEHWREGPLAPLVDATAFSCVVGRLKPEPGIYHAALEALEVPAEEAIYVGDGSGNELEGALNAGLAAAYQATWFLRANEREMEGTNQDSAHSFPRLTSPRMVLDAIRSSRS